MVISWWITRNILEQLPIHGWFYLRVVIFHRYFLVYFFGKALDLLSWPEVIKELDRGLWLTMDSHGPKSSGLVMGLSRAIGDSKETFYGNLYAISSRGKTWVHFAPEVGVHSKMAGVYPCFQWDSHLQPGIHNKSGFHNPWTILVFVTQIVSNFLSPQTHMCAHNKLVQTGVILLNLGFAEVGQRPVHVGWGDSSRHQRCGRPSDRGDMHSWSYGL